MTVKPGDAIPDVTIKWLGPEGLEDMSLRDYLAGKKVILFAVPGAFTPACAMKHLPGYIQEAESIREKGVDEIICVAVNDPFVMKHWGETVGAAGRVTLLPDGNAELTKALGLGMDASGHGLGYRSQRYMMVVDDGVIKDLQVEENPGEVDLSGAGACLVRLRELEA